jgi:hypothetical protein
MYKISIGALRDSCAAQSIEKIMAPTSGVLGMGTRLGAGALEARTGPIL